MPALHRGRSDLNLVIIADSTSSMVEVQKSLKATLSQVFNLAALTGSFNEIGLMWYTDYTLTLKYPVTSWSGWCSTYADIQSFVETGDLYPGGDEPEACKTALWEVLNLVDTRKETIIIWYGDAAPHHISNDDGHPNYSREMKKLSRDFDWVRLCASAATKRCVVCPIINTSDRAVTPFFALIAAVTRGQAHCIDASCGAQQVTKDTIRILLTILGTQCGEISAKRLGYKKPLPDLTGKDENSLQGYLPFVPVRKGGKGERAGTSNKSVVSAIQVKIDEESDDSRVTHLEGHALSMKELRRRFAEEEGFANAAFDVFAQITCDPAALLSLTYNNVFAGLWREAVRKYSDPRQRDITVQFTKTLQKLDPNEKRQVSDWLEASYDASEEIDEIISRIPLEKRFPAFALQSVETFRPQELTAVTSSCDRTALSRVINLLANVQIIDTQKENVRSLPLALSDGDLIPMLPHLMCRGLVFSSRSSAILAILAVLSRNAVLHARARAYLDLVRGQWLDMDVTGNYSIGFIRLAVKAEKILTEDEAARIRVVRELQGLLMNWATEAVVRVAGDLKGTLLHDWKVPCRSCGKHRSATLLASNGTCGPCIVGYTPLRESPVEEDRSYVFDCVTCKSRYAVIETADLKVVRPRCHYCRERRQNSAVLQAPTARCDGCQVSYIDATGQLEQMGGGRCASCVKGNRTDAITGPIESVETDIGTLYRESEKNRVTLHAALELIAEPPGYDISTYRTVYPFRNVFRRITDGTDPSGGLGLTYRGRPVQNVKPVLETVREWARKHTAELGMCMMCCEEMKKETMVSACGRSGCAVKCCAPCVTTWYGYLQRGHVLPPANMVCPFCKRSPAPKILVRHNREACELIRQRPVNGYDPGWYYGWCTECMRPRQWMEKVCAQEGPPATGDFRCESCSYIKTAQSLNARDCPGCGVTIEKTHGCDHITCRCGQHWCWRCGTKFTASTIYTHIYACRGDEVYAGFVTDARTTQGYDEGYEGYDDDDDDYY